MPNLYKVLKNKTQFQKWLAESSIFSVSHKMFNLFCLETRNDDVEDAYF